MASTPRPKRGRPLSTEDPVLQRRREQTRARMQCLRERRRLTAAQEAQEEQIIGLGEEDPISDPLGLQIQGLSLGQEPHLQQELARVEHTETYEEAYAPASLPPPTGQSTVSRPPPPPTPRGTIPALFRQQSEGGIQSAESREEAELRQAIELSLSPSQQEEEELRTALALSLPTAQAEGVATEMDELSLISPVEAPAAPSLSTVASAPESVVERLYQQLVEGFPGCSLEEHREQLEEHYARTTGSHHRLDEISNNPQWPDVLAHAQPFTAAELGPSGFPSAPQWAATFCGLTSPTSTQAQNVCLHRHDEEVAPSSPRIIYDADSYLLFAKTPAVARKGLHIEFTPQCMQNLDKEVHIRTTGYRIDTEGNERARLHSLHRVPHTFAGRVHGLTGETTIRVYILFPHLPFEGKHFKALTSVQYAHWFNRLWIPAVEASYESDYLQHLGGSWEHNQASARAYQVEMRLAEQQSRDPQLAVQKFLQPQQLEAVWDHIQAAISSSSEHRIFREAQIFLNAYNTKLYFKGSDEGDLATRLAGTIRHFEAELHTVLDFNHIDLDRFWIDIGKETCAPREAPPTIYGWKRCCLQHWLRWMYPDKKPDKVRQYYQTGLRDFCNMTVESPMQSLERREGIIYTQLYSSVKEPIDAAKAFPFQNLGLEELALNPLILKGIQSLLGSRFRSSHTLQTAYMASKSRMRLALETTRRRSAGIREEFRLSWDLLQRLFTRLQLETHHPPPTQQTLSYAWQFPSELWANFQYWHTNKYASGFELGLLLGRPTPIGWERSKVLAMFQRGLRISINSHLLRTESAMWWGRVQGENRSGPNQYGMGWRLTVERNGYGWLLPRIDWERLEFKGGIREATLFENLALKGQYLRRGGSVREFFTGSKRIEQAVGWISRYGIQSSKGQRLLAWMAHICLEQMRIDVLQSMVNEVRVEQRGALGRPEGFCYEYLAELTGEPLHLVKGNKVGSLRDGRRLVQLLFGWNDGAKREHWEHRAYRTLYQQVRQGMRRLADGRGVRDGFEGMFWKQLREYHWILPYPTSNALTQTTKAGERMWYSLDLIGEGVEEEYGLGGWEWARGSWRSGRPGLIPE